MKEEPLKAGHQPVAGLKIQPGRMEKDTTFSQIRQEAEPKHRDVIKKIEALKRIEKILSGCFFVTSVVFNIE